MANPAHIVQELNQAGVDYIVIGGVAATLHGCPEQTYDLDILYAETPENRERLLAALKAIDAEWERPLTVEILQRQPVFALNTRFGDLDIFTYIPGIQNFSAVANSAETFVLEGVQVRALKLSDLIVAKETAADPNPRKQSALAFLKALEKKQRP